MDREKVIKGLTICSTRRVDCMECPYIHDKRSNQKKYYGFCEAVLHDDALALLKEQQKRIETLESLRRIEQEGQ